MLGILFQLFLIIISSFINIHTPTELQYVCLLKSSLFRKMILSLVNQLMVNNSNNKRTENDNYTGLKYDIL